MNVNKFREVYERFVYVVPPYGTGEVRYGDANRVQEHILRWRRGGYKGDITVLSYVELSNAYHHDMNLLGGHNIPDEVLYFVKQDTLEDKLK